MRNLPQWSTSDFIIGIDFVKDIGRSKSVWIVVKTKNSDGL